MLKKLFEPISIGKVAIKNRIAMAPMGHGLANSDGTVSQRLIDYYAERAKGDVGLIVTGLVRVEFGEIEKPRLSFYSTLLNPWPFLRTSGELVETVHHYGAKIFVQLTAGFGRAGNPVMYPEPVAPSAIPNYWNPSLTCRELRTEEVERLVEAFGESAEKAWVMGYDGIDIHAMHEGYLLDQFTVAMWNRRKDKYGGELKGRLTFPIEVLHTIKDKTASEFPVQLRFSVKSYVKGWSKGGLPGEAFKEAARDVDEGLEAAKILEKEGYDSFNADAGSYDAWYWAHPPTYMPHGCYLDLSDKLKKVVSVPVLVAGRMEIPELAEEALQEGKADMIALGRGLLADPYWPVKVREERIEEIRPCLGCHDGCFQRIREGKPICCAVNPSTGRERFYELKPVQKAKKVLIAGGGVAGMEAARVAAMRGHNVTLCEKSGFIGGHLIEAGIPDFKKDMEKLLDWYKVQLKKNKSNILLNTEVTAELIKRKKADIVIIATGSECLQPKIKGVEKSNVATCVDLLLGKKKAGDSVVVIGGGKVGCETALWLATKGKKVIIIEIQPDLMIGSPPVHHANRIMLLDMLALNKVEIMTNTTIHEITDQGVVIVDRTLRSKEIECDTIALALGLKSKDRLHNLLRGEVAHLYAIGDCKEPRRILEAIWDGYSIANAF